MKAKRISPSYPEGRMSERREVTPERPGNTLSGRPRGYSNISRIAVNAPSKRPGRNAFKSTSRMPKGVKRGDMRKSLAASDGRWSGYVAPPMKDGHLYK